MIELHDYTEYEVGADDGKGGRIALCPACGRTARVERYTPIKGLRSAHYVHRVWLDDALAQYFDRCFVRDAPRGDGLGHEEAAALAAWAGDVRMLCLRLDAALGLGWYKAVTDGDARHYAAHLRAALAAAPALTEAGDGR